VPDFIRKRRSLRWPITLSVILMTLNVVLMVCWIVLLANLNAWSFLTIGTIFFALMLVGLSIYLALTIKEVRLHQRQVNFVDSVTHELKTPIASLQLYLETLQMRDLDDSRRAEFYEVMEGELQRLDRLINQLLEVARLDAVGLEHEPEDVELEPLLRQCAASACVHHKFRNEDVFTFQIEPAVVHCRRMLLEMIFGNLLDNAVKYAAHKPDVHVDVHVDSQGRVVTRITDNGEGVDRDQRTKIFQMFYRGENELKRRKKGTGLGLYIVRTLVHLLKGSVSVSDRSDGPGSVFVVELPGRTAA